MKQDQQLRWTTKLLYCMGDVGNPIARSAVHSFPAVCAPRA